MNDVFCFYQCYRCGRTATGDVNAAEPEGWDYDMDECDWLCPDHAGAA